MEAFGSKACTHLKSSHRTWEVAVVKDGSEQTKLKATAAQARGAERPSWQKDTPLVSVAPRHPLP